MTRNVDVRSADCSAWHSAPLRVRRRRADAFDAGHGGGDGCRAASWSGVSVVIVDTPSASVKLLCTLMTATRRLGTTESSAVFTAGSTPPTPDAKPSASRPGMFSATATARGGFAPGLAAMLEVADGPGDDEGEGSVVGRSTTAPLGEVSRSATDGSGRPGAVSVSSIADALTPVQFTMALVSTATVSVVAVALRRSTRSAETVWFRQVVSSPGHVKKAVAVRLTLEVTSCVCRAVQASWEPAAEAEAC